MRVCLSAISVTAVALLAASQAAFASVPTPGPVAAIGAPALLIVGGAFLAVRYLRSRRK